MSRIAIILCCVCTGAVACNNAAETDSKRNLGGVAETCEPWLSVVSPPDGSITTRNATVGAMLDGVEWKHWNLKLMQDGEEVDGTGDWQEDDFREWWPVQDTLASGSGYELWATLSGCEDVLLSSFEVSEFGVGPSDYGALDGSYFEVNLGDLGMEELAPWNDVVAYLSFNELFYVGPTIDNPVSGSGAAGQRADFPCEVYEYTPLQDAEYRPDSGRLKLGVHSGYVIQEVQFDELYLHADGDQLGHGSGHAWVAVNLDMELCEVLEFECRPCSVNYAGYIPLEMCLRVDFDGAAGERVSSIPTLMEPALNPECPPDYR